MTNRGKIKIYAPADTVDTLGFDYNNPNSLLKNIKGDECYNLNLLINRFAIFDKNYKADIKFNHGVFRSKNWKGSFEDSKKVYIERFRNIINILEQQNINIRKDRYKIDWRLAVGLGEASVYETSIKLHHVYGFPYIPASTFKGSLRSWVINCYFDGKEDKALKDSFFAYVFGTTGSETSEGSQGNVIFFDVYPITVPIIELDIINTHYSDYYKDGMSSPPGDYYSPILVNFLTVTEAVFEFIYGYDNKYKETSFKDSILFKGEPDEIISQWIKNALNYQGIGAKTSVGYGYFRKYNGNPR